MGIAGRLSFRVTIKGARFLYCRKCGAEVSDGARFCPKCGAEVSVLGDLPREFVSGGEAKSFASTATHVNNRADGGVFRLAEGGLSALLALMVLFAPVVKIDYYFGDATLSMLDVILNLSRFSDYLGKYAAIAPVLALFMAAAFVGAVLNAKQAFMNELPKTYEVGPAVKISNSFAGAVTGYALALIILLWLASRNSYGIAGASGWAWILLLGGIACEVLHFIRCSPNASTTA